MSIRLREALESARLNLNFESACADWYNCNSLYPHNPNRLISIRGVQYHERYDAVGIFFRNQYDSKGIFYAAIADCVRNDAKRFFIEDCDLCPPRPKPRFAARAYSWPRAAPRSRAPLV
mmetsp:Transcript_11855/g.30067  ORF Transcript_11855/g.30067 Transcript_11855/m.30067 type:complete len:119 (+) Transcript_11855:181-537(+)